MIQQTVSRQTVVSHRWAHWDGVYWNERVRPSQSFRNASPSRSATAAAADDDDEEEEEEEDDDSDGWCWSMAK